MSVGISREIKEQFMQDKYQYDSLSQAIRLAKNNDMSEKLIKPMILEKQRYKKVYANNMEKVLKAMPLSTNVVQIDDGWHAIRYINQNIDTQVKIDIIRREEVYLLQRDARHERELSRDNLEALLPGLIDEEALELYKQKLSTRAIEIVLTYTGEHFGDPIQEDATCDGDPSVVTSVSSHAGKRWVQRVMGIKGDNDAEEYRRAHLKETNDSVLNSYSDAKLVWEEKEDGITYWFDDSNIMYVKGRQDGTPNIITLYEEDFGFSKAINRMIALEQLGVLSEVKKELALANENVEGTHAQVEHDVQAINDEIAVLEAKIALLVSERGIKLSLRDQANKSLRLSKDRYIAEFNKLFKKWDA